MNQRMHTGLLFSFFEILLHKGNRSNDQYRTDHTRDQDDRPIMRNHTDRSHQAHTGGQEEQTHIVRQ